MRLNPWIISSAMLIGVFCYLPGGTTGWIAENGLIAATYPVDWCLTWLFG